MCETLVKLIVCLCVSVLTYPPGNSVTECRVTKNDKKKSKLPVKEKQRTTTTRDWGPLLSSVPAFLSPKEDISSSAAQQQKKMLPFPMPCSCGSALCTFKAWTSSNGWPNLGAEVEQCRSVDHPMEEFKLIQINCGVGYRWIMNSTRSSLVMFGLEFCMDFYHLAVEPTNLESYNGTSCRLLCRGWRTGRWKQAPGGCS